MNLEIKQVGKGYLSFAFQPAFGILWNASTSNWEINRSKQIIVSYNSETVELLGESTWLYGNFAAITPLEWRKRFTDTLGELPWLLFTSMTSEKKRGVNLSNSSYRTNRKHQLCRVPAFLDVFESHGRKGETASTWETVYMWNWKVYGSHLSAIEAREYKKLRIAEIKSLYH